MADYWICDAEGRVLGPVGLVVLRDLLEAGRVTKVTRVSLDGKSWRGLEAVPELARLYAADGARARQEEDARRLRAHLEACRSRPAHEVLGVPKDAPLETYREAFFRISKRFHPDKVPKDAAPALVEACGLAFRFYSGVMARVEAAPREAPSARRSVPVKAPAPAPAPAAAPEYRPEDFVGIKPLAPGAAAAEIRVTPQNVGMFTDHPLMNLGRGGFFLADARVLPLGTQVALTFRFEDPPHSISARGKVAWEDAGQKGTRPGFGITFLQLSSLDRDFLKAFVQRVRTARGA